MLSLNNIWYSLSILLLSWMNCGKHQTDQLSTSGWSSSLGANEWGIAHHQVIHNSIKRCRWLQRWHLHAGFWKFRWHGVIDSHNAQGFMKRFLQRFFSGSFPSFSFCNGRLLPWRRWYQSISRQLRFRPRILRW